MAFVVRAFQSTLQKNNRTIFFVTSCPINGSNKKLLWCQQKMSRENPSRLKINEAPSGVNTLLDTAIYPRWKMSCFAAQKYSWIAKNVVGDHTGPVVPSAADGASLMACFKLIRTDTTLWSEPKGREASLMACFTFLHELAAFFFLLSIQHTWFFLAQMALLGCFLLPSISTIRRNRWVQSTIYLSFKSYFRD